MLDPILEQIGLLFNDHFEMKVEKKIAWQKKSTKAANNNIGFCVFLLFFLFILEQMTKISNKSETLSELYVFVLVVRVVFFLVIFYSGQN